MYQYGYNNPIRYSDPDGLEPLTGQAAQDAFKEHLASRQSQGFGTSQNNSSGSSNNGDCGGSGQPPCPSKKTGDIATDLKNSFEYGWDVATWTLKETLKGIDETQFLGGGSEIADGNYIKGAALLMLATGKVPALKSLRDITNISKKIGVAQKGKAQYELATHSLKSVFANLQDNGFKVVQVIKRETGAASVILRNSKGETMTIRKSLTQKYNTFDTISGKIDGIQTDIRIPFRR